MKIIKRIFCLLLFLLIVNFNSYTTSISSNYLSEDFDYVQLSNFKFTNEFVKSGEDAYFTCSYTLSQIRGGTIELRSESGETFKFSINNKSGSNYISIPSDFNSGTYYVNYARVGGTGRNGGMVVKTFSDPEIFKNTVLKVNINETTSESTTKVTEETTSEKVTSSESTSSTSREIVEVTTTNENKENEKRRASLINVDFIFIFMCLFVLGICLFFYKIITDNDSI